MKEYIITYLFYYLLLWSQMVLSLYALNHTWLPCDKIVDIEIASCITHYMVFYSSNHRVTGWKETG
jgi:hypothetical protein